MTRKCLEKHYSLLISIEKTTKLITKLYNRQNIVADSVRASSRQKPFQESVITISGLDYRSQQRETRLNQMLNKQTAKLHTLGQEIEDYLDTVEDSDIYLIIELRYMSALSWRDVTNLVYNEDADESAPLKALDRYLEARQTASDDVS